MITVKEEFIRCDKVRRAVKSGGPAIVLVWLALKTYASEHLTDGFIPDEDVDAVDALVDARCRRATLDALVSCGRLRPDGTRGAGLVERVAGGYQLHDYLEHEQSADDARARRLLKAKRQKRWRDSRRVDAVDALVDARCASTETPTRRDGDASPTRTRAPVPPLLSSPPEKKISPTPQEPEPNKPRDRLAESFERGDDVQQLFDAWKVSVGMPEAKLRKPYDARTDHIKSAIKTYGMAKCLVVANACMNDGMVSGKSDEQRNAHKTIDYIFGNPSTFERILHAAQESKTPERRKVLPSEQLRARFGGQQ